MKVYEIRNTAQATIEEVWHIEVPDDVEVPKNLDAADLFEFLMNNQPDISRKCTDRVLGDERDRDNFEITSAEITF